MGDEEYKVLRDEMNLYYDNIAKYNIALYTASGAIFAFSLDKADFYYSLIPLLIILPLYILCERERKQACWLGAYLNVFCEGNTFNWERRHHIFDKLKARGKRGITDSAPYIVLATVSCLFSYFKARSDNTINKCYVFIPIICLLISLIIIMKARVNYVALRQKYIDDWEKLKLKELKRNGISK